jgi:hypothetical protein
MPPAQLCTELLAGRCAMAIAWPTRHVEVESKDVSLEIGCVELPGALESFNFQTAHNLSHVTARNSECLD